MSDLPNAELAQKVQQLSELVSKQGQVIAQTGKKVMEIQLADVKSKMAQMDTKAQTPDFNPEDFASNEDIVQLVCELQGQLDYIEERSIARTCNSHLTNASGNKDKIAPLCNKDGTSPPNFFPETIGQLNKISDADLFSLCEFYELIVENETNPEIETIIKADGLTKEDAEKLMNNFSENKTLEQKLEQFTNEDLNDLFDEFTRFIGVRIRRGISW